MKNRLRKLASHASYALRVMRIRGFRGAARYLELEAQGHERPDVFAQGLAAGVDVTSAQQWALVQGTPVTIALLGEPPAGLAEWMQVIYEAIPTHFFVSTEVAASVDRPAHTITATDSIGSLENTSFGELRGMVIQHRRGSDFLILDLSNPLPTALDIDLLRYVVHNYEQRNEVGIVSPALVHGASIVAGYEWDRATKQWVTRQNPTVDHGHRGIPRYVLSANAHGLMIQSATLDRVSFGTHASVGRTFEQEVHDFMAQAWRQNIRALAYPGVALTVAEAPAVPGVAEADLAWLADRSVVDADGKRRVIFVLPATSISGGIRTVFEQSQGLIDRGFAVEIWSLEGQPDWIDLSLTVRKFQSYFDLIIALRDEAAIKVATWWETAQVVWLASVNTGIPVYYVQEFETWFYPDNPIGRAAVASSYRSEFATLTTASYQAGELAEIGIDSTLVRVFYDADKFAVIPGTQRSTELMLAVGRTFFQKNFAMTAAAWQSLGEKRPPLRLFGYEPDILIDDRASYEVRPSDKRVNELYNEAAFFVQTSIHEGFSLPLIEAMAAGCPVITTDSHGNRDFCRDDENCVIVEQGDVEALAATIARLASDSTLRQRLSLAGLATAREYESGYVFGLLADFYERVA